MELFLEITVCRSETFTTNTVFFRLAKPKNNERVVPKILFPCFANGEVENLQHLVVKDGRCYVFVSPATRGFALIHYAHATPTY